MSSSVLKDTSASAVAPATIEDGSLRTKRHVSHSLTTKSEPISLSYRVSLTVDVKGTSETGKATGVTEQKQILNDACGTVSPGQMLAILGPSGAGKTSLLNCLSLRNKSFNGYVKHNGKTPDIETVGIVTAFVQQEDLFIPTVTPREHLRFHANMRMNASLSQAEKNVVVENALDGLGLGKCADTPIGGQGSTIRGISGGEKKRLSFATEVLGDASVLFVDEPTSGLDSFMAEAVVQKLGELAASGRTIIATIHQPSSQVFSLFSNLHLLAEGETIYCGSLSGARGHFDSMGHPCPSFYNPADHYIRVMSRDPAAPEESRKRISDAAAAFRRSEFIAQIESQLPESVEESKEPTGEEGKKRTGGRVYQASWRSQMMEVYKRTLIMYRREPVLTRVRLAQAVVVSILVGLIFLQLGTSQADVQSTMGLLFFVALNQGILGTIGVLQVFPNEMPVFLREYDAGAYRVSSFFFGRTLAEIPIQVIFPVVLSLILYFLVGLPIAAKPFFLFVVFVVLTSNAAISLGYAVSAFAKNVDVALAVGPMILMLFVIFGGLLINIDEIPDYFLWFSSFSFVQYGYKGVSIAIWEHEDYAQLDCPETGVCAFPSGQSVLDYLGFDTGDDQLWINAGALLGLMVGFRIIAFLALLYRSRPTGDRAY